jgi:Tfp pilus assembly protein PilF
MIGDIYMQGKNQDSALANYKRAVQIDDFDIMAHYGLYQLYLRNGDTTNAFVHYEKIQKYSPDMLK